MQYCLPNTSKNYSCISRAGISFVSTNAYIFFNQEVTGLSPKLCESYTVRYPQGKFGGLDKSSLNVIRNKGFWLYDRWNEGFSFWAPPGDVYSFRNLLS